MLKPWQNSLISLMILSTGLYISFALRSSIAEQQAIKNKIAEKPGIAVAEGQKFAVNSTGCNDGDELTLRLNEQNNQMEYGCYSNGGISTVVFTFTDLANTTLNVLTMSDIVKITGISSTLPVTISGSGSPQFRICADATCSSVVQNWGNAEKTIANNEYLQLRINPTMNTLYSTSVKVGGVNDEWRVGTVYQGIYVDDVFSTYLYTGNGSTQTINNGIDLAGSGGMVWTKQRDSTGYNILRDNIGSIGGLSTNDTSGQYYGNTPSYVTSFINNGYVVETAKAHMNDSNKNYVSWTFRKAPKFFDVVTYTGDGTSNRQIAHSLGIEPGMVIVKATSATGSWYVWHRSFANLTDGFLNLNGTSAYNTSPGMWGTSPQNSSTFTVSSNGNINSNGVTYVAYLYAHDASAEGVIQCGSFTTDGSGNASVNFGWEPQYVTWKASSTTGQWYIEDSMRGLGGINTNSATLISNLSNAEGLGNGSIQVNATGFTVKPGNTSASQTHIYCAIRRPNKPPVSSAGVYKSINYSGDGTASRTITGFGFPLDFAWHKIRGSSGQNSIISRLQGVPNNGMATNSTAAESDRTPTAFLQDGLITPTSAAYWEYNTSGYDHIVSGFRRAPGFFDIVVGPYFTGNLKHNLTVTPELVIVKQRDSANYWYTWHKNFPVGTSAEYLTLESTNAKNVYSNMWQTMTNTEIGLGNVAGGQGIYYLFATLPGISKVGSYTGTGAQLDIDAGFATGPAFLLIKRTDATGDWYLWDSTRGIVSAGNDPYLLLNSTAAEVTNTNYIDPINTGFRLTSSAPAVLNASGGNYIYYSVAKP